MTSGSKALRSSSYDKELPVIGGGTAIVP